MDTKKLRQKILDLAIHGKLVPQDPNDEPASVLLERIRAEKEALIKEGKIKRAKNTTASDTPHYENVPFDVPDGWCWCRLEDYFELLSGQDFPPEKYNDAQVGIPYIIGASNIYKEKIVINRWTQTPSVKTAKGDLLVVCKGAGVGKMALNDIGDMHIARQIQAIRDVSQMMSIEYIKMVVSYYIEDIIADANGLIPGLKRELLLSLMMPIPPLQEQRRIIATYEQLMSFIESIDNESSEVLYSIKTAKSKILDLAIHGKLVPQDPNDEPASELLKRINTKTIASCDNPHYTDLPRGWVMLKGKDLFKPMKSTKPSGETFKYIDIDSINNKNGVVTAPKILKSSDAPSRATRFTVKGDIVFSMVRPYLRNIAIVPENGCIASTGFYVCSPNGVMSSDYCYYLMTSNYVVEGLNKYMKGDNSPSINNNHINEWLFPVPPLKEQLRIVSKLQDILSQLDSIMSSLQA